MAAGTLRTAPPPEGHRFEFGSNWSRYLEVIDEERITLAMQSLRERLRREDLSGASFLDAGCGSGLFSLAATRLGAERVMSFDFDPSSVETARILRERYGGATSNWDIEPGDVLNREYLRELGQFDVVYSWGVLHHTGDLRRAMANIQECVAPDGLLFIAIYNDQGIRSRFWRAVKKTYNRLARPLRVPYALLVMAPQELLAFGITTLREGPRAYLRLWRQTRVRGMSRWHDLLDWVGGYPFEVARIDEVFDFYQRRGFVLLGLRQATSGCNEFVFRRYPETS
jgi:2-polyprenyl-3-methyl-5-hydroxy-6-metoxy-1,4-benzoquinol methylase